MGSSTLTISCWTSSANRKPAWQIPSIPTARRHSSIPVVSAWPQRSSLGLLAVGQSPGLPPAQRRLRWAHESDMPKLITSAPSTCLHLMQQASTSVPAPPNAWGCASPQPTSAAPLQDWGELGSKTHPRLMTTQQTQQPSLRCRAQRMPRGTRSPFQEAGAADVQLPVASRDRSGAAR